MWAARGSPAAETKLTDDLLDRIDQIVTPGTNSNPVEDGRAWHWSRRHDDGRPGAEAY
jgi:hypothetical protein